MKEFPPIPRFENASPELSEGGHLWIQEMVDGANVRFQVRESGLIRFGDRNRVYDEGEIPTSYRHLARHVRERLDREALRDAVDVESVAFFGESMHRHTIDYDWDRVPSFLGFDVWSDEKRRFLPPDAVERIYSELGLTPINTFEKEVRAVDFDPDSYEIPRSRWYDGPAMGVVVRNKTGQRAKLPHPELREVDDPVPVDDSPDELARRYATNRRIERAVTALEDRERPATVENTYERVLEVIVREEHGRLFHDDASVDVRSFRSEVAARVRRFFDDRG